MLYQQATKTFVSFLTAHPEIRQQIRAAQDQTLLYAGGFPAQTVFGSFLKPMWREIADFKRTHPEFAAKQTLDEVLGRVPAPGTPYPTLLAFVADVERQVPWRPDGFRLWRVLSGIFASNATGKVSFQIGSGVEAATKVFATTEVPVLLRNPNVDETTKDLLAYFQRCIQTRQVDINIGLMTSPS